MATKPYWNTQKIVTTKEQSEQLLAIGVPADSADCVYEPKQVGTKMIMSSTPDIIPNTAILTWNDKRIPSWSATRLINLFLTCYCDKYTSAEQALSYIDWDNQIDWLVVLIIYCAKKEMLDFSKLEE